MKRHLHSEKPENAKINLTLPSELVQQQLDWMDSEEHKLPAGGDRREARFIYRVRELTLELSERGGPWLAYVCPSRNISAHGLSVVIGRYIHPNTPCRVILQTAKNQPSVHVGKTVRCRYIPGTGRMHELGIRFDNPLNVSLFQVRAAPTRILLADNEAGVHKLVTELLTGDANVLTGVNSAKAALEALAHERFDIGILDDALGDMPTYDLARRIRERGHSLALIALTAADDEKTRELCVRSGVDQWLVKPMTQTALLTAIRALRGEPLISWMMHQPGMMEQVDQFVNSLDARMRDVRLALASSATDELAALSRKLRADAELYGFNPISAAARAVEESLKATPPVISDIGQRVGQLGCLCRCATGVSAREKAPQAASEPPASPPAPSKVEAEKSVP